MDKVVIIVFVCIMVILNMLLWISNSEYTIWDKDQQNLEPWKILAWNTLMLMILLSSMYYYNYFDQK